jgi:hypothetical protein
VAMPSKAYFCDLVVGISDSNLVDTRGRAVLGEGLLLIACWGCGFEFRRGAWMFVFCVVSKDKMAKCRTMKRKKQVRMKY